MISRLRTFRVWITGYSDSYVDVGAYGERSAMLEGARTQRASHHGEIVEINVVEVVTTGTLAGLVSSRHVRLYPDGRALFV